MGMSLRQGMGVARGQLAGAAHSGLIMLAAVLLILPGFLSDAMGLLLLIPAVRGLVIGAIAARARVVVPQRAGPYPGDSYDVIDAEVVEEMRVSRAPNKPSGWTQS